MARLNLFAKSFIIGLFSVCMIGCGFCQYYYKYVYPVEFKGELIRKYYDQEYKNTPRLVFDTSTGILKISPLSGDTLSVWSCLEIGDSVYKRKDSFEFIIIKKDTKDRIKCEFDCDLYD